MFRTGGKSTDEVSQDNATSVESVSSFHFWKFSDAQIEDGDTHFRGGDEAGVFDENLSRYQ